MRLRFLESDTWSGTMRTRKATITVLLGTALIGVGGCRGANRFDTSASGAFCGELVAGVTSDGLVPDVQDGARIQLKLALTLDSHHLSDVPGTLTSNDDTNGLCSGQRLFEKAPVRTIQPALRDAISGIQITQDHEQDVFTWVDSTCQGTFVAILSLMVDGKVEVRLFKPLRDVDAGAPANQRSGFGVFSLARSDTGCGF